MVELMEDGRPTDRAIMLSILSELRALADKVNKMEADAREMASPEKLEQMMMGMFGGMKL